ncbi:LIM homeobox transcription factor 1-beta [Araneus ventricosus]|uniref:LIM homeobox transcription factor 1-beta n=1 Tax=Araneus ventricosus TaxID=182803 RepID=A0A4Y2C1S3_ARAVE|nr:LIM homeobox transcription factor 1-beta [Araneus ventricosus]
MRPKPPESGCVEWGGLRRDRAHRVKENFCEGIYVKLLTFVNIVLISRLFAVKCTGCVLPIAPTELVMRALDHVYHLPCFVCVGCGRQLQKGDQFVIRSGRLYCRPDFEKEMAVMQIVTRGENGQLTTAGHNGQPRQDGRRGPKRPRTILTTAQRRAFKASFEISQKPCRKVRESLAKETGLSVRIVQVWFQNQRAKLKKLQRKQQQQLQQQNQKQGSDGQQNGASNPDLSSPGKDGKKSDDLSHGDPGEYCQYYSSSHPDAQYMKSDISMDSENSLGGLEDVLISQGQATGIGDGGGHIFPSSVNPIDKLYSMQTSYFSSNECECLGATN